MAYNRSHARKLCTEQEYKLFSASLAPELGALPQRSVAANIKRARTARDKHSDLLRRQTIGVRRGAAAKTAPTAAANQRTANKAKLFDEALKRFEAQFKLLEKAAAAKAKAAAAAQKAAEKARAKAAKQAATKKLAATKKVASIKKAAEPKQKSVVPSKKSVAPKKTARDAKAQMQRISTHQRSSNARGQAKRDKR
jgi:colicin import membrane protein